MGIKRDQDVVANNDRFRNAQNLDIVVCGVTQYVCPTWQGDFSCMC
jgi:hypothetical protein